MKNSARIPSFAFILACALIGYVLTGCGSSRNSSIHEVNGPSIAVLCSDLDRGTRPATEASMTSKSGDGDDANVDTSARFCLEAEENQSATAASFRLFELKPSGATRTLSLVPVALTSHKAKDGAIEFFAHAETLALKIGDARTGLCGEASALPCRLEFTTMENGQMKVIVRFDGLLSVDLTAPERRSMQVGEYPYQGVDHFSNIYEPLRGLIEIGDIAAINTIAPAISPAFNENQRIVVYAALRVLMDRAFTKKVISCTRAQSGEAFPAASEDDFNRMFVHLAMGNNLGENITGIIPFYVAPTRGYTDSPGQAYYRGFFAKSNPYPGLSSRRYFYASLNADYLGTGVGTGFGADADYWAGVLGRLMMHDLGYHGLTAEQDKFLLAYQHCIENNGAANAAAADGGAL